MVSSPRPDRLAASPPVPPRAVLAVHARGTHGREEEEDVAREGEMAAENKPEDEHGHLKIYLPKKLLECLPKCTSLPKERHRWNTNELLCHVNRIRACPSQPGLVTKLCKDGFEW
ncbi:uncharacterized protein LOC117821074 isoform X2 [Notolabrus celidotus]|uniref:uncharacterized protein LOC117821074 isoform X2 n=1 Tax=Notolabrus celidotus TaxID=1203425 RepID=UPI001490883C|nr:uncharacterized protein LOC117821074 isoform X2 [Notolabrus celidotus]